jgi:hypothetical protein
MHSENPATAWERTDYPRIRTKPLITGNMIKAGRALASISQRALAKASGIRAQPFRGCSIRRQANRKP